VRRQEKDSVETGDRRKTVWRKGWWAGRPTKKEGKNGQVPGTWPYRKVGEKKASKNGQVPGTWLGGTQEIGQG
jgi:hypothetical protein